MPRDPSDVYYLPPGSEGVPDTTIESEKYNLFIEDVEQDLNRPRPIVAGGTGASSAASAMAALGGELALQHITNFDADYMQPGSFWSAAGATNAPVSGHAFVGTIVSSDLPVIPPANLNVVITAHDQNDTQVPGRNYVREMKAGVWGPWKPGGGTTITGGAEGVSATTGDMFYGIRGAAGSAAFVVNDKADATGTDLLIVKEGGEVLVTQAPTNNFDVATKKYVDDLAGTGSSAMKSYVDAADANLQTQINTNSTNITNNTTAINGKVAKAGDTMTGVLHLAASTGVADEATRRDYIDFQDNQLLNQINLRAPTNNPVFTGDPRAPTPAPGDNDTSIATTAFVNTALSNAGIGGLGLARTVDKFINAHLTSANMGFAKGMSSIFIMKDGTVRSAGAPPSSGNNQSLGKGAGGNSVQTIDLKKIALPAGLLGTPVSLWHNGGSCFILTDQGDVCGAGRNDAGDLGVGDTTAREIFTLLPATNIGPRSAGGVSRRIIAIGIGACTVGNPNTVQPAYTFFLCADNTLWATGNNGNGQLAQGNTTALSVPTQCLKNDGSGNVVVADAAKIFCWADSGTGASAGYIDTSGKVRLVGRLSAGSVGRNTSTAGSTVFRPIFTTTDIAGSDLPATYQALDLCLSLTDTIMMRCADKCLYAWGQNGQGQCGLGNVTAQNNPQKVGKGTAVATTLNGTVERVFFSMAVNNPGGFIAQLTDGSVYCWGSKSGNTLPISNADGSISTPTQAQGLLGGAGVPVINKVFGNTGPGTNTGIQALFAWLANGTIVSWGSAGYDGTTQATFNSSNPRTVALPSRPGSPTLTYAGCAGDGLGTSNIVFWAQMSDGYLLTFGLNAPDGIGGQSYSFNEASIPVQ